ncbi:MAG: hypothetical protein QXQ98_05470 [Zestosphaera sp.]
MVFMMFYVPCLATVATIYRESKSLRFTLGVTAYLVLIALIVSLMTYRILLIV